MTKKIIITDPEAVKRVERFFKELNERKAKLIERMKERTEVYKQMILKGK